MNERVKELRKYLNLSMDKFGSRLGVTRSAISRIENGTCNVTNQMLSSICREFNVNEEWLRTGEGEMFNKLSRSELAARVVGEALGTDDEFMQNVFIALGELTPAEWKVIKKFVDSIKR